MKAFFNGVRPVGCPMIRSSFVESAATPVCRATRPYRGQRRPVERQHHGDRHLLAVFTPWRPRRHGPAPPILSYFPWLVGILLSYCLLTQLVKGWYIRRYHAWL
jgi:hypothetical protein